MKGPKLESAFLSPQRREVIPVENSLPESS